MKAKDEGERIANRAPHTSLTAAMLLASILLLQPASWYNGRSCERKGDMVEKDPKAAEESKNPTPP